MWKRLLPLLLFCVCLAVVYGQGWHTYLTFEALKNNRQFLLTYKDLNPVLTPLLYICLYVGVVAFSLPGATLLTVAGGFLFGQIGGTFYTVVAATVGATFIFLIAKTALGAALKTKAGPWIQRLERGFHKNPFSYLLTLRLIPIFPFFIVNLVPAFFKVPTRIYVLSTFIGIIPATAIYVSAGVGLGSIFESNHRFSIDSILTSENLIALCGLALLAFLPIVYKRLRAHGQSKSRSDG